MADDTISINMFSEATFDLTGYKGIRIKAGDKFVATTPERFVECMSWLLCCVDTDTAITKDGVEVEG